MYAHSVAPNTPDSAGILVGAAGDAANVKRNKTIMNCFRDRTPSYARSNSRQAINGIAAAAAASNNNILRKDATIHLKDPPAPRRPVNKLALLNSGASTRDLTRLIEFDATTKSSTTISSSSSSSTNSSLLNHQLYNNNARNASRANVGEPISSSSNSTKQIQRLEQRLATLEQDLQQQRINNQDLEDKLTALKKRFDDLEERQREQQQPLETRKKLHASSSVRKKDVSNTSGNVQPSRLKVWTNLTTLWNKRPSIETLKQQNIYNDEPCFDTEIELVLKHELKKNVPKIVVDCCDLIEEKYRLSSHPIEGIYRQCGDYNKIQTLRFRIDANDYEALRQPKVDIHTLTGVLKLFLREIKTPLVSTNEAKTFIGKPNQWLLTELPRKIDILTRLIRSLPEINRDTMEYLFAHFNKLTKVPLQQVSAETLSLSVSPAIFQAVQQGLLMQDIHTLLKESEVLADCVKIMIEYQSRIFHA